jgi:hypothetical protein
MVPVPIFEKLSFRFQFLLLKSYGSSSGSSSISRPSKANFSKKMLENILPFCLVICFTWKKLINFNKFIVQCEWKKWFMKEIKYIMLYLVPVPGTVINNGSDFLTDYGSGSNSTSQQVTVPTVPVPVLVPQRCQQRGSF